MNYVHNKALHKVNSSCQVLREQWLCCTCVGCHGGVSLSEESDKDCSVCEVFVLQCLPFNSRESPRHQLVLTAPCSCVHLDSAQCYSCLFDRQQFICEAKDGITVFFILHHFFCSSAISLKHICAMIKCIVCQTAPPPQCKSSGKLPSGMYL